MSDNEAKDSKLDDASEPITIRIRDQDGSEMYFKIKQSTKMQKVFDTYAGRKGFSASTLRFLYDGHRINSNDTPKMLEMEDQDQIDCKIEMSGGSF